MTDKKKEQIEKTEDVDKFFDLLAVKGSAMSSSSIDMLNSFKPDPIGDITTDGNGRMFLEGEEV